MEKVLTNNYIPIYINSDYVFKDKKELFNRKNNLWKIQVIIYHQTGGIEKHAISIFLNYRYNRLSDTFELMKIKIKDGDEKDINKVDYIYKTDTFNFKIYNKVGMIKNPVATLLLNIEFYKNKFNINMNIKYDEKGTENDKKVTVANYKLLLLNNILYIDNIKNKCKTEYNIIEEDITESIKEVATKVGLGYIICSLISTTVNGIKKILGK